MAFIRCQYTNDYLLTFKRRLNELFSRRNIIAHQSDRAHTDAQVNIITKEIVQNFICDIEKIVRAIDAEARNK